MPQIIFALVWLSLFTNLFLVLGIVLNLIQNKGFTNLLEILLFIGTLFTVFILGMVAITGQFLVN